jgi:hypothetical protein
LFVAWALLVLLALLPLLVLLAIAIAIAISSLESATPRTKEYYVRSCLCQRSRREISM